MAVFSGPEHQQVPGAIRDRFWCAIGDADRGTVVGRQPEPVSCSPQVLLENVANVGKTLGIELAAALNDLDDRFGIGVSRRSYHA